MHGGELYVPQIPSMKISDLAQAIAPGAPMHNSGLRPGEKLHEEMISADEGRRTVQRDNRYIIQPDLASWGYTQPKDATPVPAGFHYTSDKNDRWYTAQQIANFLSE
jgi:FlaA1/EpsC-like NDP-sugar epimerase